MADALQELLGPVRAAVQQYDMIGENDRIAVGLSGGKDSAALLAALAALRRFYPIPFQRFDRHYAGSLRRRQENGFLPPDRLVCLVGGTPHHPPHPALGNRL